MNELIFFMFFLLFFCFIVFWGFGGNIVLMFEVGGVYRIRNGVGFVFYILFFGVIVGKVFFVVIRYRSVLLRVFVVIFVVDIVWIGFCWFFC